MEFIIRKNGVKSRKPLSKEGIVYKITLMS